MTNQEITPYALTCIRNALYHLNLIHKKEQISNEIYSEYVLPAINLKASKFHVSYEEILTELIEKKNLERNALIGGLRTIFEQNCESKGVDAFVDIVGLEIAERVFNNLIEVQDLLIEKYPGIKALMKTMQETITNAVIGYNFIAHE